MTTYFIIHLNFSICLWETLYCSYFNIFVIAQKVNVSDFLIFDLFKFNERN